MDAALSVSNAPFSDNELLAALAGAAIGMAATVVAMRFARATERKKLTLEVFVQKIWDKDYIMCVQRLQTFARFIETASLDAFLSAAGDGVEIDTAFERVSEDRDPGAHAEAAAVAISDDNPFKTPKDVFRSLMNFYEIMAIGIRDQILDETICKRYMFGELMQNWRSCKGITDLLRVRTNNDRIYREVENLAKRWARNPPRPESALLLYLRGWY